MNDRAKMRVHHAAEKKKKAVPFMKRLTEQMVAIDTVHKD
jgi:hypothetical protein